MSSLSPAQQTFLETFIANSFAGYLEFSQIDQLNKVIERSPLLTSQLIEFADGDENVPKGKINFTIGASFNFSYNENILSPEIDITIPASVPLNTYIYI